jgi:hypothetical protein
MTHWLMMIQVYPGNYRRNGDNGELLGQVLQASLSGLPSHLIGLWPGYYPQLRITYKVLHRLDQHHELQDHPRTHPTIPIATTPCRDPAVSSLGDC